MRIILSILLTIGWTAAEEALNFNRDIRPILSDRCFHCHGPDEHERKANLRLDLAGGEDGAYRDHRGSIAIKPGSPDESEVWHRINTDDEDEIMPPPGAHKKTLTGSEKERIRKWIEQGAVYESFWAFVPPFPVEVKNEEWSEQPIDRYVMRRLEEEGLSPKGRADRRTMIRRLALDLTGLPPTREEIRQFIDDREADAYERLVDRYLARPQYGEHMAKYWLDLVRFADSNGIHHDHFRDQSPYRDWVIRAFNENLSYDQFITWQLAGDLFEKPTTDQLVASGFHRLHLIIDRGTRLPEESYVRNVLDRVEAVGTALLGLTVQCAVCHDHKYDPISMRDFYQLYAFFNNLDAAPETGGRSGPDFRRGLQPPYIEFPTPEQNRERKDWDKREAEARAAVTRLKMELSGADESAKAALQAEVKKAEGALKRVRGGRDRFVETITGAMVMKEREEIRPAHILIRGAYDNPGEVVGRGTPSFLPPMKSVSAEQPSRMDLANWFVSADHPLTARVAVNRFWQQLFGVGIVKTSEDLGAQGEWPSHPELLDYLAWKFQQGGWNIKALMREMVLSETYRQSSRGTPEEFAADPENRLLARGSRFRLDSEVIRDQILATGGLLHQELYGKSVKPPQPEGLWKAVALPSSFPNVFFADEGKDIYRRSVYTFWKRGLPPPQMTILNAPTREYCTARRERTNTPLQALLLMNEPEYFAVARNLASEVLRQKPEERIAYAYETITSQLPDESERSSLQGLLVDLEKQYRENSGLAAELVGGEEDSQPVQPELAAWTVVLNTIYNLDITKTRQ